MESDSVQDSTRYVVSGLHHGSVLPGKRAEMWRNAYLLPGTDIRGGVWCDELAIHGPDIKIAESVYARGRVTIADEDPKHPKNGNVTFESCITTPDALMTNSAKFKTRFLSDVYVGRLNISNAIIYGNVFAKSAIIRDSIILGGVFCQGKLEIEDSLIGTFKTRSAVIGKNVSLLMPFALSHEHITLQHPVNVLTFYSLYKHRAEAPENERVIILGNDDVHRLFLPSDVAARSEDEEAAELYCLSVAERILDSDAFVDVFEYNCKMTEYLSLGKHFDSSTKGDLFDRPMEELEERLWETLRSKPEERGAEDVGSSIEELFKRVGERKV
jgi:hypothetical protein